MEYELRVIVEKVAVSTQKVVKRDTLKVYDIKSPDSILELGLRNRETAHNVLQIRAKMASNEWHHQWQGAVLSALGVAA